MRKRTFRENLKSSAFRELLIIGLITIILFFAVITLGWSDKMINFLYRRQDSILNDIVICTVVSGILFMIFAYRRYNEKVELIRSLEEAEAEQNKTYEELQIMM